MTPDRDRSLTGKAFRITVASFFIIEIMTVLGSVIDGFIVGNTMDEDAIAAIGLVSPAIILFSAIGTTVGISFQVRSLKCLGRGDTEGAGRALVETLALGLGLSVLLMAAVVLQTGTVVRYMIFEENSAVFRLCEDYLRGISVALPAMTVMSMLLRGVMIEGKSRVSLQAVAVMAAVNILGDIMGARFFGDSLFVNALFTSLSYYAGTAVLAWHFTRPGILIRPVIKGISFRETLKVNNIGMWGGVIAALSGLTLVLRADILNAAIEIFEVGNAGLQAYNVQTQMNYVVKVFQNSAISAMFLLGGLCSAEEDRVEFKKIISRIVKYDVLAAVAVSFVMYFFAGPISRLYLSRAGSDTLAASAMVLKMYAAGLVFQMIILLFANYIQCFDRYVLAFVIIFITNVIVPLYGASFGGVIGNAVSGNAVAGMFGGISFLHFFTVLFLPLFVLLVNRRFRGKDYWWMLPESFGTAPENELRAEITTEKEVIDFTEKAEAFCREKGESQRICYMTSLAIEEMATNVVEHGFTKDDNEHILSVRLVYKPEELILRFRDDCPGFDPRRKYEKFFISREDAGEMIGLRVIMAEAKEVSYTSMLALNNLIIWINTGKDRTLTDG